MPHMHATKLARNLARIAHPLLGSALSLCRAVRGLQLRISEIYEEPLQMVTRPGAGTCHPGTAFHAWCRPPASRQPDPRTKARHSAPMAGAQSQVSG
jgi:hypothetical protein